MNYIKRFNENFYNDDNDDFCSYSLAHDKIDKMLPDDKEIQDEFFSIIDSDVDIDTKNSDMDEFLTNYLEEDRFYSYCKNGNIKAFAEYIIKRETS